jgi:pheromone shutdown protein TraB
MYSRLDAAGFDSGEEFVRAVKEGQKLGADIVLGDRDVEVTLRRVTEGLAKTDLKALLSPDSELEKTLEGMVPVNAAVGERLAGGSGSGQQQELTDAQFKEELTSFVETMKTKDNVKKIMGQLQRVAPFLYEALVSERDVYMATGLNGLNELETIVAVVGIAHADGIETTLQQNGWQAANPRCPK